MFAIYFPPEIIINMTTAILLERLHPPILDVINNPKKTQKTACIGTLL